MPRKRVPFPIRPFDGVPAQLIQKAKQLFWLIRPEGRAEATNQPLALLAETILAEAAEPNRTANDSL